MIAPDRASAQRALPSDEVDPTTTPTETRPTDTTRRRGRGIGSVEILCALLILLLIFRYPVAEALSAPWLQTWATVFVSVMLQAVPFLVFGVVLSAVIAVFVPRSFWARVLTP